MTRMENGPVLLRKQFFMVMVYKNVKLMLKQMIIGVIPGVICQKPLI